MQLQIKLKHRGGKQKEIYRSYSHMLHLQKLAKLSHLENICHWIAIMGQTRPWFCKCEQCKFFSCRAKWISGISGPNLTNRLGWPWLNLIPSSENYPDNSHPLAKPENCCYLSNFQTKLSHGPMTYFQFSSFWKFHWARALLYRVTLHGVLLGPLTSYKKLRFNIGSIYWNATLVFMSTEPMEQRDVSPCSSLHFWRGIG